jgi:hypothetical protein
MEAARRGTAMAAGWAAAPMLALAVALAVLPSPVRGEVTRIEIVKRDVIPGPGFGAAGVYERLTGRFHGELDPAHPLNRDIVDIALAPRNARGRVEYTSDLDIVKPVDLSRGNGALLYDVNNRGNKRALRDFNDGPDTNNPLKPDDFGNGFLLRQGFTLVWSGWIHQLPPTNNALRIQVPSAPGLAQEVWDELLPNTRNAMAMPLTFRAASTDPARAKLYRRVRNADQPVLVPAGSWEYAGERSIRMLPAGTPFEVGVLYQFVYPAENPPVSGIGFAATRDLVSFLRHDRSEANPLAGGVQRTLAYGASQSGRYLRDFTWRGFNEDEAGRQVFDAINPHISTARLFLNQRFAQPIRMTDIGYGFLGFPDTTFPFAYQDETDPFGGRVDGILNRCRARNNCPKVVHTTTGIEYWQSGQSLVTTDPTGRRDGTLPDDVRIYHFAGTQHIMGATMPPGVCALPPNTVDPRPLMRNLLLAMDRWVRDGTPPPPSAYPKLSDGTLVAASRWRFPNLPGVQKATGPAPKKRFDYGPDFAQGRFAGGLPGVLAGDYPVRVPQVDADGNEIGGLRVPEQAVPVATSMGWGVRSAASGTPGELCYLDGSIVPFLRRADQRRDFGDPRPSLAERYQTPEAYLTRVRSVADGMVKSGLLLEEDAQRIEARAARVRW